MGKTPEKYWTFFIYVALVLSTLAVFWQVRHHEFIGFDDDLYVFDNSHVKTGLTQEGLVWAFTTIHAYNWHPLTWLSHMLDWHLFGSNPTGHHLTNLVFHIANTLFLFIVLKRMTRALWPSAFVAALFALHPLHVESVAWASERKDVLSTFFWMLTMWNYVRYTERPNITRYLLMVLSFCLGLMAKQMLVTLPFVLLLLDYWPLGRLRGKGFSFCASEPVVVSVSVRRCILEKLPLLILSVVAGVIVYVVQQLTGTVKSFADYPLMLRIGNALVAYTVYIGKMLWPTNLAIFYPHRHKNLPAWQVMEATLLLGCITAVILWKIRQKPYLVVGWLWYLGTLVPVIGLVQIGLQAYADRYTYIPLIGLFIAIAWGIPDIFARVRYRKVILSSSAVLLLLTLGVIAWHQVGYWRNSITLYRHAVVVVQDNWWAHNFLGKTFESQGRLDEAVAHFNEVLQIDPNNSDARNSLGKVLIRQGKFEKTVKMYQQILPMLSDNPDAPNAVDPTLARQGKLAEVLGVYAEAHVILGKALFRQGKFDEAVRHYEEAVRFQPEFVDAYKDLGSDLLQQGEFDKAVRVYRKVLQILPDDSDAHGGLGIALGQQGKLDEAITHFTKALAIDPTSADAHSNLGYVLFNKGRLSEAVTHFSEAVRLDPNSAAAHYHLGNALKSQGKLAEAVEQFRDVLRLHPDFIELMDELALLLATNEEAEYYDPEEAVLLAERACELSDYELPEALDTLAVAYSAMGRFSQAIETAEKAVKLADAAGKKDLAQDIRKRLELYKAGRPYCEK